MSLPVSAFHFAEVVGITAAPPPIARRSLEKSTSVDARVHQQAAVERVDAGEDGAARLLQDVDEAVHVARIRDQPVLGADREVGDEVHHQREDVIERQRRDHDFLARDARRPA